MPQHHEALQLLQLHEIHSPTLREEFDAYCQEFLAEGKDMPGFLPGVNLDAALRDSVNHPQGIGLSQGWVPTTSLWLLRDGQHLLGRLSIRHSLTPWLEAEGGHIGYAVRASERRRGYATLMLSLALPVARQIGLTRVLITCDKKNIASARVIQKNGGILEDERPSQVPGREIVQRYWIELP